MNLAASTDLTAPEREFLLSKLAQQEARQIGEIGAGTASRLWAEHSTMRVVSWAAPGCVESLRAAFAAEEKLARVEWRAIESAGESLPWKIPHFDFLFIDPSELGSDACEQAFRFGTEHVQRMGLILWHDADRPEVLALARKYFSHCSRHRRGRIGWCHWQVPGSACCALGDWWRRVNPFA